MYSITQKWDNLSNTAVFYIEYQDNLYRLQLAYLYDDYSVFRFTTPEVPAILKSELININQYINQICL